MLPSNTAEFFHVVLVIVSFNSESNFHFDVSIADILTFCLVEKVYNSVYCVLYWALHGAMIFLKNHSMGLASVLKGCFDPFSFDVQRPMFIYLYFQVNKIMLDAKLK